MRKLTIEKRTMILSALVEGNSVNSTARMTGCSKVTILRLLADVGQLAADFHDLTVRNLQSRRIQVDEAWSFVGAKQKNVDRGAKHHGNAWVWVAMDADSKLVVSYLVGDRDSGHAHHLAHDIADRLDTRVQLTTDGLAVYVEAVEDAFGVDVDFAQLIKIYRSDREGEAHYSPAKCIGCERREVIGDPNPDHISTSFVERQNLTMRMGIRRMTRLTNAHSKKFENHCHAIALHMLYYNFCRRHSTLKTTPAVAAGVADREWSIRDIVEMLENEERIVGGRLTDYLPASK